VKLEVKTTEKIKKIFRIKRNIEIETIGMKTTLFTKLIIVFTMINNSVVNLILTKISLKGLR
jgi:hypothetical protein